MVVWGLMSVGWVDVVAEVDADGSEGLGIEMAFLYCC